MKTNVIDDWSEVTLLIIKFVFSSITIMISQIFHTPEVFRQNLLFLLLNNIFSSIFTKRKITFVIIITIRTNNYIHQDLEAGNARNVKEKENKNGKGKSGAFPSQNSCFVFPFSRSFYSCRISHLSFHHHHLLQLLHLLLLPSPPSLPASSSLPLASIFYTSYLFLLICLGKPRI